LLGFWFKGALLAKKVSNGYHDRVQEKQNDSILLPVKPLIIRNVSDASTAFKSGTLN
jgi:hypothetical protein